MARKVVYIHGFNSSELSYKATAFGEYMSDKATPYLVPRLHFDPRVAMAQLDSVIDSDTVLLGSSLGGYYATYFSQHKGCKAVLINPAVRPFSLLNDYLGPQYNPYQDCHYELSQAHIAALRSCYVEQLTSPENLLLLQQTGDEVLPFEQAVRYYSHCRQIIEFGGDHSFVEFSRYFATIAKFLNIRT
ncbi:YqiA/YcfP family alpha/beta fold hydrolase [Pseudoalteromonas piscicida]|uniref:Esterase YqiA n=1 Tax=Pseudoalteromonas piscicida TaxID=43662 RepID=A0A2A5JWK8_PSEO7|nr:YqiA/YcfP family alpha/beta fold hydrolase [Pseudoalteromonas piscicida]PCK33731.1 esterase YqiA [Pseudoalteromonas piscicida]